MANLVPLLSESGFSGLKDFQDYVSRGLRFSPQREILIPFLSESGFSGLKDFQDFVSRGLCFSPQREIPFPLPFLSESGFAGFRSPNLRFPGENARLRNPENPLILKILILTIPRADARAGGIL